MTRPLPAQPLLALYYGIAAKSRTAPARFRAALDGQRSRAMDVIEMTMGQTIAWQPT